MNMMALHEVKRIAMRVIEFKATPEKHGADVVVLYEANEAEALESWRVRVSSALACPVPGTP